MSTPRECEHKDPIFGCGGCIDRSKPRPNEDYVTDNLGNPMGPLGAFELDAKADALEEAALAIDLFEFGKVSEVLDLLEGMAIDFRQAAGRS